MNDSGFFLDRDDLDRLGLSVQSLLASDDGERAFVTAQRGSVSHHSTPGCDMEHQRLHTRVSKIVAPLSCRPDRKHSQEVQVELSEYAIATMFTVNISSSMLALRTVPECTVRKCSFRRKHRILR